MARPRSADWLEDEILGWKSVGLAKVVSLLEPSEVGELGLEAEASLCAAHGINFEVFPIADRGTPNHPTAFLSVAAELASNVRSGSAVAVHCRCRDWSFGASRRVRIELSGSCARRDVRHADARSRCDRAGYG